VVLACDGFARAVMTAAWLRRMGLPNAVALAGGLEAWKQAGGAIESGHPPALPWGWDEARRRIQSVPPGPLGDAAVIDVDTSDAYARGHVPGATWTCRSRLELEIGAVAPDRARPLVVTCADGVQSTLSAVTLADIGYSDVRVLDGGTRAWAKAGLPVETGLTRLAGAADDVVLKPYEKGRAWMEAYLRWEEELDQRGTSPHDLIPADG
jgi:rhodanese-related sulfurtransferase